MPDEPNTPQSTAPQSEPTEPTPAPVTSTPAPATPIPAPKKRAKWLLPVIAGAAVLLLGGGAYGYFGVYTQTPENIWKASVKNTGEALNTFVKEQPAAKKGAKLDGSFKVASPFAADGTITSAINGMNSSTTMDVGVTGVRANMEMRTIAASGATSPDLYMKISGVKGLATLMGASEDIVSTVDGLDGKWLMVDHTLLDQYQQSLTGGATADKSPQLTDKDLRDIETKMAAVLRERLFTTDESKAVVKMTESFKKEDFQGRKSQHVKVKVVKAQLREMVIALKDAAKTTKLKDLVLMGDTSRSFEEALNFDDMLKSVDNGNYDKAYADVWLDMGLKYVRNVRITDPENASNYVDFMLDYTGGDDYPFSISYSMSDGTSGSTDKMGLKLGMAVNRKSLKSTLSFSVKGTSADTNVDANGSFTLTPSDDAVSVDKPAGATNIMNMLGGYMNEIQSIQNELSANSSASLFDDIELAQ